MNVKVYILAAAAVTVGLVELIVGGILPTIADDLHISLGSAGQLITIFALVYAISGPVLLSLTGKFERKKLLLFTLFLFSLGNVMTFFSPTFTWMMIARVITAVSASLVISLAIIIAGRIVAPSHRAKAIGLVFMGVSSALVLGVPIGILLADMIGWRALFLIIGGLALLAMLGIYIFLETIPSEKQPPLLTQVKALGNIKIAGAHFATMFTLAGHYTLYAYFAPFLEKTMQMNETWVSISYFLFGIAAVAGGALGGALADKFGSQKSILFVIGSFAVSLFILPYTTFFSPLFLIVMMLWGALSWALAPPQQNYIIETDPVTSDIHQSFNNSALQAGIALGSLIGGTVIGTFGSVVDLAPIGAVIVVIAFCCAWFSLRRPVVTAKAEYLK